MPSPPRNPKAEQEAIEWLERLESPCVPHSEIEAFETWLNASEDNRHALNAVRPTWRDVTPAAALIYRDAAQTRAGLEDSARRIRRRNNLRRVAIAGGAVAACLAALFLPLPAWRDQSQTVAYTTTALELRTIDLNDGSRIELSPLARANVFLNDRERRVDLSEGVAYFDVAHDAARPFVVTTPFGIVRVRGTSFVVRIGEDGASVVVLRGAVEARPRRGTSLWSALTDGGNYILADADKEVQLADDTTRVGELDATTRDQRVAWRDRRIALEDVSLREAADEVTRYSGVVFEIADERLAQEHVSLFLEGGDVEGFLRLLRSNLGVSIERRTDTHIILRRAQQ